MKFLNRAKISKRLIISQRQAVITLIEKKDNKKMDKKLDIHLITEHLKFFCFQTEKSIFWLNVNSVNCLRN